MGLTIADVHGLCNLQFVRPGRETARVSVEEK